MQVLDDIEVKLEPEKVLNLLHTRNKSKVIEQAVYELVDVVRPAAKPKAVYKVSYVDSRDEDSVVINGVTFTSRVLKDNLDTVERVFPYIATCGRELNEIDIPPGDFIKRFCLDAIKTVVLGSALTFFSSHIKERYALEKISHMNLGSLKTWPISQQKPLFSLFGNTEELIGVTLSEDCVMIPVKSSSGIYFTTEVSFESCQLCPRERCIGRRAPYERALAEKYS